MEKPPNQPTDPPQCQPTRSKLIAGKGHAPACAEFHTARGWVFNLPGNGSQGHETNEPSGAVALPVTPARPDGARCAPQHAARTRGAPRNPPPTANAGARGLVGSVPGFLRFWDIGGVSYMRQLSLAGQHRPRKWRSWPFPAILFRANRSAFSAASALLHRGACSTRMESCADVVNGEFS